MRLLDRRSRPPVITWPSRHAAPASPLTLTHPCRCQDENRHGDFFTACLKARPELVNDWQSKLWSRFFCLSVYITMYLNDHQRAAFYGSLGLNTTQFNQHVIIETNKTTARIFPEVGVLTRLHALCLAAR